MSNTTREKWQKAGNYSFPPSARIKKSFQFKNLQACGQKLHCKHFLIIIHPSQVDRSRLGITVTTKIDKRAVVRNKIKRRIRETFRLNAHLLTQNFDIIVIARKNAGVIEHEQTRREILGALRHKGYLKNI